MPAAGVFIAAVGLPGAGKSSVTKELARLAGGTAFVEPDVWGAAVANRDQCGHFTALQWFRSERVPMYFEALEAKRQGGLAILDSYYDKLCSRWLGKPGMEWLIAPSDPYFDFALQIAARDWQTLPLVDALVVFDIDEPTWQELLRRRGRSLDEIFRLSETFATRGYFVDAALELAATTGVNVVRHRQRVSSPQESARELLVTLRSAGLIP